MSATGSRLIDLPVEIFQLIQEHLVSPRDYFHLAITCRGAWARDTDVLSSCILRDARILRAQVRGGGGGPWAVELADDASVARWLVDRGVRVRPRHMFVLHNRRLVRWGSPEWHYFMYASNRSGGVNLSSEDDYDYY
ncbi:uncharacterized protein F4812DRAFT_471281 [Daldinia caldariorum]|uniref:uncharacterized protein n=1 Tax=Daldinia caldariorum TaxID=326644 RepID=UPI002007D674|nr:uncharacterized protein F4812DRAFT_471281 [Daldinia caldariorum]KAI1467974.1 hypothetical protein F4812DRAFT_471281 [Daldinia caldariorum]